ncbi:fibronectin type III domain-containing protein [Candidatus Gottesmanbacteria bacterium]|nr:fibronectin type III domain-containing protein [Candidatus Gottesmanbacteria bacterium]
MYHQAKKIPTIVALLLLIIGIGGGIYLVEQRTSGPTKALVSIEPSVVQITNITDSSFSIVWLTNEPASGTVAYGTNPNQVESIAFDDRDIDSLSKPYTTHQVTLRNLSPKNTYYFTILSSDKKFNNGDKPYSITTPLKPDTSSDLEPAYGQVVDQQNQPAQGALVILNLPRSLPLSTLVKDSGNWLVPLNIARDINLNLYTNSSASSIPISITILLNPEDKATATTDTKNDSPVPPITIGKTYNFEGLESKKKNENPKTLAMETEVLGKSSNSKVEVLIPQDGQTFVSTKPLFRGIGMPGEDVLLEISQTPLITGKTIVSEEGRWSWSSPKDLAPDKHKITITTTEENGDEVSFVRNFLVFKSGTQVLGDATPSASTPTPTSSPSATLQPLFTPTPTTTPLPVPVAGSFEYTLILIAGGSILSVIGFAKLISRG